MKFHFGKRAVLFFCVLLLVLPGVLSAPDIVVSNQRLFVDGTEFIVVGMNYQPVPITYNTTDGICALRETAYGEYKSACFDMDYYDGSVQPGGLGPAGRGWFSQIWERDLANIASMGVNTIRLYSTNPTTKAASEIDNGTHSVVAWGMGKEHISFLDACEAQGLRVIFPLVSDCDVYETLDNDTLLWLLRNQIDEVGNHSALLMYVIGNEPSFLCTTAPGGWPAVVRRMGWALTYAKAYQAQRWGRNVPFMTSVLDAGRTVFHQTLAWMPGLSVIGINSYQGARGNYTMPNLYSVIQPLVCEYDVGLMISEFNPQGFYNAPLDYAEGIPAYIDDFINHVDTVGIVGYVYFEYTNEDWKRLAQQDNLGVVQTFPPSAEALAADPFAVDQTIIKNNTFEAICCGTFNGQPRNFRTPVWDMLGRLPYNLSNVVPACGSHLVNSVTTGAISGPVSGPLSTLVTTAATGPASTLALATSASPTTFGPSTGAVDYPATTGATTGPATTGNDGPTIASGRAFSATTRTSHGSPPSSSSALTLGLDAIVAAFLAVYILFY